MKDNNRQFYRNGKWSYLLDDDAKTARIVKGHIGRCKRFRIPESVEVDGERYKIVSVEIGAFNKAKCLKHLVIPDSMNSLTNIISVLCHPLGAFMLGKVYSMYPHGYSTATRSFVTL